RPWRFLILRGDDRHRLGAALDEAAGKVRRPGEVNEKPLRAELLLALVSSPTQHEKVPEWEQHATAAGAGHLLELALWQAGWAVMWRSGTLTNTPPVRRLHRLDETELLMGWFYIGAVPERYRRKLASSTRPLPRQFSACFDFGVAAASIVVSSSAFFRFVFSPSSGRLVDAFGERRIYITGLLIVAASTAAVAFAQNYWQLLVFRGLGGIGST